MSDLNEIEAMPSEIKRLQEENEKLAGRVGRVRGYNDTLREKVKDLEPWVQLLEKMGVKSSGRPVAILTDEIIDAAWQNANEKLQEEGD